MLSSASISFELNSDSQVVIHQEALSELIRVLALSFAIEGRALIEQADSSSRKALLHKFKRSSNALWLVQMTGLNLISTRRSARLDYRYNIAPQVNNFLFSQREVAEAKQMIRARNADLIQWQRERDIQLARGWAQTQQVVNTAGSNVETVTAQPEQVAVPVPSEVGTGKPASDEEVQSDLPLDPDEFMERLAEPPQTKFEAQLRILAWALHFLLGEERIKKYDGENKELPILQNMFNLVVNFDLRHLSLPDGPSIIAEDEDPWVAIQRYRDILDRFGISVLNTSLFGSILDAHNSEIPTIGRSVLYIGRRYKEFLSSLKSIR